MSISLLTPPHNFAVCKLDERKYPGVVVQGDSFFALYVLLQETLDELRLNGCREAESMKLVVADLQYEVDKLRSVVESYEQVCEENGFELPYVKVQDTKK